MTRVAILTVEDVSEWIKVPVATLVSERSRLPKNRKPVPWFLNANGKPAYREDHVQQWLDEQAENNAAKPIKNAKRRAG